MELLTTCRSSICAVSLTLALLVACDHVGAAARPGSAAPGPTIKIGVAAPLTGDNAHFGPTWVKGMKLAVKQFPFQGKYAHARIELSILDTRSDLAWAVRVAHRLVAAGVDGVIGPFTSGEGLASEPVYHGANLPELPFGANPRITQRGYRNVIVLNANSIVQGQAVARFATQLHLTSVAVVHDSGAYGQSVADAFTALARKEGLMVDGTVGLSSSSSDYRSALRPLLAKHPAAIYLGVSALLPGVRLCHQARNEGFTGTFLADAELFHAGFITGCGPRIGKAYVGVQVPPYNATRRLRAFTAAYEREFGTSPAAYAVYGYAQMAFLLAAIDAAQSTQHAAVIAALHRITYDAILGPIHVDSDGKMLHAPMYLYMVSGQRFRLIGPA